MKSLWIRMIRKEVYNIWEVWLSVFVRDKLEKGFEPGRLGGCEFWAVCSFSNLRMHLVSLAQTPPSGT